MRLGFVGVGTMGRPIAAHLVRAGHDVIVWDMSSSAVDALVAEGATSAADIAAVAAAVDVVFLSLPGPAEVEGVVTGPAGLLAAGRALTVIDLSTNSIEMTRRLADRKSHRRFATACI